MFSDKIRAHYIIAKKAHSAPSAKPPKKWWDKKYAEVKKGNPEYSDEQIRKTVGKIWYSMSHGQRRTRREREGKTYRKAA